jgi:hypothetical protein
MYLSKMSYNMRHSTFKGYSFIEKCSFIETILAHLKTNIQRTFDSIIVHNTYRMLRLFKSQREMGRHVRQMMVWCETKGLIFIKCMSQQCNKSWNDM